MKGKIYYKETAMRTVNYDYIEVDGNFILVTRLLENEDKEIYETVAVLNSDWVLIPENDNRNK